MRGVVICVAGGPEGRASVVGRKAAQNVSVRSFVRSLFAFEFMGVIAASWARVVWW